MMEFFLHRMKGDEMVHTVYYSKLRFVEYWAATPFEDFDEQLCVARNPVDSPGLYSLLHPDTLLDNSCILTATGSGFPWWNSGGSRWAHN
jgi:hypothetical protein